MIIPHESVSIRMPLFSAAKILLPASVSLNIASITESSVDVVSYPTNAVQSFTTKPLAITSEPLLTVPAQRGIYRIVESSSNSATLHMGCTRPPLFVKLQ